MEHAVKIVEQHLARLGWSQAELARKAGINSATVGDFLAGGRWPQRATRNKIESALGLPAGTLAEETEEGADDEAPMTAGSEIADVSTPRGRAVMALIPGSTEEERRQIAVALLTWPRGE